VDGAVGFEPDVVGHSVVVGSGSLSPECDQTAAVIGDMREALHEELGRVADTDRGDSRRVAHDPTT
jgi:hypothetical protein